MLSHYGVDMDYRTLQGVGPPQMLDRINALLSGFCVVTGLNYTNAQIA